MFSFEQIDGCSVLPRTNGCYWPNAAPVRAYVQKIQSIQISALPLKHGNRLLQSLGLPKHGGSCSGCLLDERCVLLRHLVQL